MTVEVSSVRYFGWTVGSLSLGKASVQKEGKTVSHDR